MHICVISHSYPTSKTIDFVFVDQLCRQFADKGHQVTVIAPQSITKCLFRGIPIVKYHTEIITAHGNAITLLRPTWLSMGNKLTFLVKDSFKKAVMRTLRRERLMPDVIYGHFWAQAIVAMPYAKENNIPLFAVAGEGVLDTHRKMTQEAIEDVKNTVRGVICVSSKSKKESIDAGFADENQCVVIPNAIDDSLFYPRDRHQMRLKHGFNNDDFIVAFVGQFNGRKGVHRLSEALSRLNNPKIKAMFMGRGAERPTYKHTILEGTVNHDELPEYLSAADVFVLPTVNEGCCNAIIEAMACRLPILSSDRDFNHDVLNKNNSILFNPYDIPAIAAAIKQVYEDSDLCQRLSVGAINTAKGLVISARADRILNFIKERI